MTELPVSLFGVSETTPDSSRPTAVNLGPLFEPPPGFPFAADSYIRRYTEPATFALYPYIAGLTVMNDKIAAGVKEHSSFTEHPWGRLLGTVDSAITLIFGNREESLDMATRLWNFHEHTVQGQQAGEAYSANDATLQAWVLTAVFKGLEETNRRWGRSLDEVERAGLYDDIKTFGAVFGIPDKTLPENVEALDVAWEAALNGDFLLQTEISREMSQKVFRFTSWKVPRPLACIGQAISIASLDPRLQAKAQIRPTPLDDHIATIYDKILKNTYGRTPRRLRESVVPGYINVRRRLAPAVGKIAGLQLKLRGTS